MSARHRIGGYREYDPVDGAAFFCEAFWTHHAPAGHKAGAAHRVLPDPALSIAYSVHRDRRGYPLHGRVVVIGPKTRPQVFPIIPGFELDAVRLKLEWVAPMLGIDPGGLDNQIVDFAAIRSSILAAIEERLWRTRSAEEALPILAQALLDNRASRWSPPPAAAAAMDIVRRSSGRVRCQRVADALGVSMRHLRRQVRDSAGMTPKNYARTVRLGHAMQIADGRARPDWADLAVEAGYCDQSHLIRDCLALGGASPQELHLERTRQRVSSDAVAEISNPA